MAVGAEPRHACREVEHLLARPTAVDQGEQRTRGPAGQGTRQRANRRAVVDDAGSLELLVDESLVRLGSRVQQGHASERNTRLGPLDDAAERVTDLIVAVGGGEDGDLRRGSGCCHAARFRRRDIDATDRAGPPRKRLVGRRRARDADDDRDREHLG